MRARTLVLLAVIGFAIGAAFVAWLAAEGNLRPFLGANDAPARLAQQPATAQQAQPATSADMAQASVSVGGVETRLALLEERMARLNLEASAASGHAARAEGLLIAFAARRLIDRGRELGFVADQLTLRFGGAQGQAVRTVTEFARAPVTGDELSAGLDALSPALAEPASEDGGWSWIKREVGSLFMIRRSSSPALSAADRVQRAKLLLASGKITEAIEEVDKLPGADKAGAWTDSARRYQEVQQALDVIETAAMLEPRGLKDAQGRAIDEASPLAQPAAEPQAASD